MTVITRATQSTKPPRRWRGCLGIPHRAMPLLAFAMAIAMNFGGVARVRAETPTTDSIELVPMQGQRPDGTARIAATGDGTWVVDIGMSQLAPGNTYMGAVHLGSCDEPGNPVIVLGELQADARGRATAST